jgi:hypothetical protein
MALDRTDNVSFMIVASGGGEDGFDQTAYYIGQKIISDGGSVEQGANVDKYWSQFQKATTYDEYKEAVEILLEIPGLQEFTGLVLTDEEYWKPYPRDIDAFFNPMDVIDHTTIPMLIFFGEMDKNVDPVQGVEAYKAALQMSGNQDYQIELLPGVAHVFVTNSTYLETLETWLLHLSY